MTLMRACKIKLESNREEIRLQTWAFLLLFLLLFFLQDSDGLVSKWYFCGHTIFCNLSSMNISVMETLDSIELLMEDQA